MPIDTDKPAILTDIEGTTSAISFVRDVLFPYARERLPAFVARRGKAPEVHALLDSVAQEIGATADDAAVVATLQQWIDEDRKHTVLKTLQGMIWEDGYTDGDFVAPLYPDVAPALDAWAHAGHALGVYSSGSVPAQKLLFGHTDSGDLTALFQHWFDTTSGHKRDANSYRLIADAMHRPPEHVVFLSDVVEELDAAREAGMRTVLLDRLADYPQPRVGEAAHGHTRVEAFNDIQL